MQILPLALVIAPFALFCGIIVKVINKYRAVNVVGWIISIVGFGFLSLLRADSPTPQWVGFQFLMAAGTGIVVSLLVRRIAASILTLTSFAVRVDHLRHPGASPGLPQRRGARLLHVLSHICAGK